MFNRRSFLCSLAVTPLLARPVLAASPDIFAVDGLAIRGTDPVAYFTDAMPVAGSPDHTLVANRAAFEADPTAYAPQYGGYCAYAASKGAVATTVPEAWTVHEGKLYLNYSTSVRGIWSQDVAGNIALADANWPSIL